MTPIPGAAAMTAWKQQIDLGLQVAEAIVAGVQKAREMQRDAAAETHAQLEAARSAVATTSPTELAALQMRLANENLGKMAQYWTAVATNARDTQVRILELVMRSYAATPLLADGTRAAQPSQTLNELVDAGYKQWLNTLRSFYAPPVASGPG